MKSKKLSRPDLIVGHMAKTKKERIDDAVFTFVLAALVVAVYVLYILD